MSAAPRRPPLPGRKPGLVKVYRAMYKYEAQQSDELSFDEGDIIYITDTTNSDWWRGRSGGREGLVPSNYVEENAESIDNPMHEAAKRGNLSFLNDCINNRVAVNGVDKAGSTPLHWAAHGGHVVCLQALLAVHGCQITVQNKLGDTALHSAAWKGHAEAVKMLLEKGARTDLTNNDGKTPFALAKDPETAALLRPSRSAQSGDYGGDEDSD